jgi:hypothetical protein
MAVRKNSKGTGRKAARVGAAAFAVGLFLAGPQAGWAAADAGDGSGRAGGRSAGSAPAAAAAAPAPAASTSSSSTRNPFFGKSMLMFGKSGLMVIRPIASGCMKVNLTKPLKDTEWGLAGPGKQCQAK